MFSIQKFLLILFLFLPNSCLSTGTPYECSLHSYQQTDEYHICDLFGLNLTREDYNIDFKAPKLEPYTRVVQINLKGVVPILSFKSICEKAPHIKRIYANALSIEEIEDDAFQGCSKIERIFMKSNNFTHINRNAFKGLPRLEKLQLGGGNIQKFDVDLRDSVDLLFLELEEMGVTEFPANNLQEQKNLEMLAFWNPKLFDLDIEQLLKYTPRLQIIYLLGGNFKCSRLRQILLFLGRNGVSLPGKPRKLDETYSSRRKGASILDGFDCLSDEQWETDYAAYNQSRLNLH